MGRAAISVRARVTVRDKVRIWVTIGVRVRGTFGDRAMDTIRNWGGAPTRIRDRVLLTVIDKTSCAGIRDRVTVNDKVRGLELSHR